MDTECPEPPVSPAEVLELMDTTTLEPGTLNAKPIESTRGPSQLTWKGRKRKAVMRPEEGKTERVFLF